MTTKALLPNKAKHEACVKCGAEAFYDMEHMNELRWCGDVDVCVVGAAVEHLHVTCWRCNYRFVVYTKDYVGVPPDIEIPTPESFEQEAMREVEEFLN